MKIAFNKNALKQQRDKLSLYRRYLPSLELKRQQLLAAWRSAQKDLEAAEAEIERFEADLRPLLSLLGSSTIPTRDLAKLVRVREVSIGEENVVGVRVPTLEAISFERMPYSTLALPFWVDG
ncbi:MAG: V-type ATP synthase subunit D, partial [Planctomycetota bacterium]